MMLFLAVTGATGTVTLPLALGRSALFVLGLAFALSRRGRGTERCECNDEEEFKHFSDSCAE